MIWQEGVKKIVMVTNLKEKNRVSVSRESFMWEYTGESSQEQQGYNLIFKHLHVL